jgi:primosomal protein N' (replication factor Y)
MTARLVQVALPLPLAEPYTYAVPETLGDRVVAGARVVVPVRRRELIGIVVGEALEPPAMVAREILGAPDAEPALLPDLLRTAEWLAGYYGAPLGLTLRAMLPAGLWGESRLLLQVTGPSPGGGLAGHLHEWLERRGGQGALSAAQRALKKPLWDVADRLVRVGCAEWVVEPADTSAAVATERRLVLAGEPLTLVERGERFARAPRQRALYEALESLGGGAALRHLRDRLDFKDGVIRALLDSGLVTSEVVEAPRDPFAGDPGTPAPATPTAEQAQALLTLDALAPGGGALLLGVTGSGKTLVYLEAIRRAVESGHGAIILVPEIGLTPQTVSRVRGVFGDQVAVLHSALSDGERADAWRSVRRGERQVVVGARSAIFAPVPALGVIVVDEEHEASYKNGETPRYHAREVARVRASIAGARLILGSATPSLETLERAREGLTVVPLPSRVGDRPLPPVEILDLRQEPLVPGLGGVAWAERLDAGITTALARREQVLLLLNRRGFSAFLQCPSCGDVPECPNCSISLTVHRTPDALRCHYCGHQEPLRTACAACGHAVQRALGVGTQQLERLVAERFPEARLARMDLDTTSTKWSHHRILGAVGRGEVDILIGTQMIAKGMDFPNVTLVGVVDADTALHLPDFRAAERTFQLVAQVAGRAGRGPRGGRVLVQTRNPGHHALVHAARHDVAAFAAEEREHRASPLYPPLTGLVNLVVSGEDPDAVATRVGEWAGWWDALLTGRAPDVALLGPAPCPIARIKSRYRWHLVLKGPAGTLGKLVRYVAPRLGPKGGTRTTLDRDPVSLL